jgi:hypothetical protein
MELSIRCHCGALGGVIRDVTPHTSHRGVCYCDDCQTAAQFFSKRAVLDERGGTDVLQISQSQVKITRGAESLRCLRLSPKGLMRWHAACCDTPIANTMPNAKMPFVGILSVATDHAATGVSRDEALGRPHLYVHGRFARGGCPPYAAPRIPLLGTGRFMSLMFRWWLRGMHRPSPFFDDNGQPRGEVKVLTIDERRALRDKALAL